MNFAAYLTYFEEILKNPVAPYDNLDYYNYAKLNWSRTSRWLKTGIISDQLKETIASIKEPQLWTIITEPWCGDASHVVPFLQLAAEINPLISIVYQLRDSEPFLINQYLTNGGKSIPKLIMRNNANEDLVTWGPRPASCQIIYDELKAKNADFEEIKIELQKWYNHDRGTEIMKELALLIHKK
jgi:hypothetical protein